MRGIVLAGGSGTRLWPATSVLSKQLLPVFDKPMIYYPLSTLMLAGVREILIITTPHDQIFFKNLLGDGSDFGLSLEYAIQKNPAGLAEALIIAEDFIGNDSTLMILGDNIFHGVGLGRQLQSSIPPKGAHIFAYEVSNPSDYGVLTLDEKKQPKLIEEKPKSPKSNLAITGLYFFDNDASKYAKEVKPSARGELEITSLINTYLDKNQLTYTKLNRGVAWLDTGTPTSLQDAATYIRIIEERTGMKVACLEEIAFIQGWIKSTDIQEKIQKYKNNSYAQYLSKLI
jgi:glucose-1-phosphate thymidylyltransferase